jgi:hypothetical protein
VGGLVGALVLFFAYVVGIALVGAGVGALVAHVGWSFARPGDPPVVAVVVLAVLGAVAAMLLQRYVIVSATAFGGAWTMILGGLTVAADRAVTLPAVRASVWILYPTTPDVRAGWVPIAWVVLGFAGTFVQLRTTGNRK